MYKLLTAITLSCVYNQSLCQKKIGNIETFFPSVVFITTPKTQILRDNGVDFEIYKKNPISNEMTPLISNEIGTGFLVGKDLDGYLVTAEHVAKTTNINSSIVLCFEDQTPIEVKIKDLIEPKYIKGNEITWFIHPNADVAVIPIIFKNNAMSIPFEFLLSRLEPPLRQRNLVVFGYPLGLGIGKKTSPISKKYNPASGLIDLNRFDNNKPATFFLIDDPSIGGLSGGPVVAFPQTIEYNDGTSVTVSGSFVMGLVHGTINRDGGGYGAIVPSSFIVETINSAPGFSGKYEYKYKDGKIWSEVNYKNGFAWEVISNYSHEGKPHEKGTLKDGDGTRYVYDEDGKLVFINHYKNGRLVKNIPSSPVGN